MIIDLNAASNNDKPEDIKAIQEETIDSIKEYLPELIRGINNVIPEVKGDEKAIDVCAAPGGKALHLADRLKNGTVIACDLTVAKTGKIEENIKRCGIKNIKTFVADAIVNIKEFNEAFDIVTADLPCSGLGVIGSKPDIRYKTSAADIAELAGIQKKILKNVSRYLVPGGMLSFSTCTFTKEENEDLIAGFLNDNDDFEKIYEKQIKINDDSIADGFYMCFMRKV